MQGEVEGAARGQGAGGAGEGGRAAAQEAGGHPGQVWVTGGYSRPSMGNWWIS